MIARTNGERYYIATMRPCTEDNHRRVEKHRRQREGLDFRTLELAWRVQDAPITADAVVLLEDVSNLFANVLFDKNGSADDVFRDIRGLMDRCRMLVAVTISDMDAGEYEGETADYINGVNHINQRLYDLAEVAVTMRDRQPVYQKGGPDEIF